MSKRNPVKRNSQRSSQNNVSDKLVSSKSIRSLFIDQKNDQKILTTLDVGEENNLYESNLNSVYDENDHYDIQDEQIKKKKKKQQTDHYFHLDIGLLGLQTMDPGLSELQNQQNQDIYNDDSKNNYEVGEIQIFENNIQN